MRLEQLVNIPAGLNDQSGDQKRNLDTTIMTKKSDERQMSIYPVYMTIQNRGAHEEPPWLEGAEGEPEDDERGHSWAELVTEHYLRNGWARGVKQIQPLNLRYIINEKNPISPVKMIIQKKIAKYWV